MGLRCRDSDRLRPTPNLKLNDEHAASSADVGRPPYKTGGTSRNLQGVNPRPGADAEPSPINPGGEIDGSPPDCSDYDRARPAVTSRDLRGWRVA